MTTSTKAETPEYALGKRLGMLAGAENKSPIPGEDETLNEIQRRCKCRVTQLIKGWRDGYDSTRKEVMAI